MDNFPKCLVISHNCFSKSGSNGRTLANFFSCWPKESLAQFYISNEIPDSDVCNNYFRVTDVEALKAFYKCRQVGTIIKKEKILIDEENLYWNNLYVKHRKKRPINYVVRNLIWDSNRWKSKVFEKWLDDFKPDVVVLQLGDYAFMLRIALGIAKKRNIPLVIYNSEDYYFKDINSFSLLYHFYRLDYKRQVRKLISYSSHSIYNSEMLQQTYQQEFEHQSSVIMTSTDVTPAKDKKVHSPIVVSYLGNLGVGRHEPLIEIAKALHHLDSDIYLDIYGKIPNKEVEKTLKECDGIRLKGFVSYEEVIDIMKSSDLLVHAENFSDFYRWDLKHAFSTKIADSLASGTCFFVYAPENTALTNYLLTNQVACVVTEADNLLSTLSELLKKPAIRKQYTEKALKLVKESHEIGKNREIFREILENLLKNNKLRV